MINPYSITWDTWILYVKCALNTQINATTGETPHCIIFGEDKTLPYELLDSEHKPSYNHDDYIKERMQKFQAIHQRVRSHMRDYSEELREQQHKNAREIIIKPGDIVMAKLQVPIARSNKFSPKFSGPQKVIEIASGNKFKIQHTQSGEVTIRHVDDLKRAHLTDRHRTMMK